MNLLAFPLIFCLSTAIQVPEIISIYCSSDFLFEFRLSKVCRWLYSNGTAFEDNYQSAVVDCPYNHILAVFDNFNGSKFTSYCQDCEKIWINGNSSGNSNVLIINTNGSIEASFEPEETHLGYFMCVDKTQKITCGSGMYLDTSTLLCVDCHETEYWNGTHCTQKETFNKTCVNSYESSMCADYQGLNCINGKCVCNASSMYYDLLTSICVPIELQNQNCLFHSECNQTQRSFCSRVYLKCIECPIGWNLDSGFCYFFNNNSLTWSDAKSWCAYNKASLLGFLNLAEYNFFKNISTGLEFWIGLKKYRFFFFYAWLWSYDFSYYNDFYGWWASGEPQSYRDCGLVSTGFKMYSSYCSVTRKFFCEMR